MTNIIKFSHANANVNTGVKRDERKCRDIRLNRMTEDLWNLADECTGFALHMDNDINTLPEIKEPMLKIVDYARTLSALCLAYRDYINETKRKEELEATRKTVCKLQRNEPGVVL
jgi:hypothetical protein